MPTKKSNTQTVRVDKAINLTNVSGDLPRFKMSEMSNVGLKVANGVPYEELKRDLQFPQSMHTYKQMSYDATIAAAISLFELFLSETSWTVRPPEKATEEDNFRADFIKQCMNDMDHTWLDFLQEAGSMFTYGFSIHEKVYRRRTRSAGSRYNDGLIGWKKLPIRSQETIHKFIYNGDGTEIVAVEQDLRHIDSSTYGRRTLNQTQVIIPRNKYLHFILGKSRENPVGRSPLRNAYYAWKYRCAIEEQEAIGIQRDLSGYPVITVPPQIMAEDATPEQKAQFAMFQNIIRNMHMNQQAGLILPAAYDPETKKPLYDFKLMSTEGGKAYDTSEIIRRYDYKILTSLFADVLLLGQSNTGSFALGSLKNNLMTLAIEARLREIANVINRDLIPQTFQLNGWITDKYPEVIFDDLSEESLDEFGKYLQRVASVGLIEKDRSVLNKVRIGMGIDPKSDDEPVDQSILTGNASRAGDGMTSAGDGTSNGNVESNDNNLDNAS